MPASLIEWSRRIAEKSISAMLAKAGIIVFEVPQALIKLLGKISLYSFVLTFHLAFVIYHSTKPPSDDARGYRKPEEPGVSTRDYGFSSIKLLSIVLGELISPHNEGDTTFIANISCPRLRSSTTFSEIARHSSSNTSVTTLVETDTSKETTDVYTATLVPIKNHGTIFPDSEWATMNSTQIRRIRRAVKRVKYKEEHGPPPRDARSKGSKAFKTSEGNKENVMEDDREPEQEISKKGKHENNTNECLVKDDKEDDRASVKEDYSEDVKEVDDEGSEGLTDDVFVYDQEGVEEDFMKKDGKSVNELTEDDNRGVEEQCAGEDDLKEMFTEGDDNVCVEEGFMEDNEGGKEDVTKVDNEGVEDKVAAYDSAIVEKLFTINRNEGVKERDYERIRGDVPEEHNKVINERAEDNVAAYDSTIVEKNFTVNHNERIQDDVPEEYNKVVTDGDDIEGSTKTAADGACSTFTPLTLQHNGVIMIPSHVKGWPPVLLSEPIVDRLDPIDFRIMQLEYEYYLSREELHKRPLHSKRDGRSLDREYKTILVPLELAGEDTIDSEEIDLP